MMIFHSFRPGKLVRKIKQIFQSAPPPAIHTVAGEVGKRNVVNREVWLEKTLAAVPAGSTILDAGAGELQYKRFCAHLKYVSQDFAQYDGSGDTNGLQTGTWDNSKLDLISDITSIPMPDASFDAIMCIEVFEHIPNPVLALRELTRLLKPGGTLILTAPFCSLTHFSPYFFYTGYSRYFYEHWLDHLGYIVDDMQWNGNYFEYLAQELRRLPWTVEHYAKTQITVSQHVAINTLLEALAGFSQQDQGSEQFLAYGIHVRAHKR